MYYPPRYLQHFLLEPSIFVHNFYSRVNFGGKNCGNFILQEGTFLRIAKKPANMAKIRTRKNLVPHG